MSLAIITNVFVPANFQLAITCDALTTATYTLLTEPGVLNTNSPVTVAAGTTATLNGYYLPRNYQISSNTLSGMTYAVAESGTLEVNTAVVSNFGNGAKNGSTVTCVEYGDGVIHKTVLTCTSTPITISDDAGTAQYGGVKVYDFPEGLICMHGAVIKGTLLGGVTGTITDTFAGGVALGTVTATTGATLVSTEATWLPENDVPAATAKVATVHAFAAPTALTESGARWVDGTATAADLFLNFVIDDDVTHTSGTAAFTGTITFVWENQGDV